MVGLIVVSYIASIVALAICEDEQGKGVIDGIAII
jgi:hypothetical protein